MLAADAEDGKAISAASGMAMQTLPRMAMI
jgi:hypothetical protein